jgi:hypothetical protein
MIKVQPQQYEIGMFGSRKSLGISMVALVSLLLLALFVWPGHDSPPANEVAPVGLPRQALGYFPLRLIPILRRSGTA